MAGEIQHQTIVNRSDLKQIGITASDSTLLRWEYYGRFPRRLKLARTRVAWLAAEVQQWIKDASDGRDNDHYTEPE